MTQPASKRLITEASISVAAQAAATAATTGKQDKSTLDADVATKVGTSGSATNIALRAAYVRTVDPLAPWRQKLASNAAAVKIVLSGDSTMDATAQAGDFTKRLQNMHTVQGQSLYGMTPDRYTDGVTTSGSPTLTSATAAFTSADVGKTISGTNLPLPAAKITAVTNSTTVTLSQNATGTGSGLLFNVGRHVINRGYNGMALSVWLADSTKLAELVADAPDLIIASWGINDVRTGQTTQAQLVARLQQYIDAVRGGLPNTPILLRIPAALTTTDSGGTHYVTAADGTINPAGAAQTYSTILRNAYLALSGVYPYVAIADVQGDVLGVTSRSAHPLMGDQIHPGPANFTNTGIPFGGGQVIIADHLVTLIGPKGNSFGTGVAGDYNLRKRFYVTQAGNGFLDLAQPVNNGIAAAQFPITTADVLFIDGMSSPVSLSSASFQRPQSGTSIRIFLAGTDFTPALGLHAYVGSNHPDATTNDRQIVSVDLPSIAAGAYGTTTVTVTGASTGNNAGATSVTCSPPNTLISAGLYLVGCYPSNTDTVTLVVFNPTGAAVDLAAANFAFWVVR